MDVDRDAIAAGALAEKCLKMGMEAEVVETLLTEFKFDCDPSQIIELEHRKLDRDDTPWDINDLLDSMHKENESPRETIPTGLRVDYILDGGLRRQELVYVAGRPSAGKSAFVLEVSTEAAKSEFDTLMLSLEMGKHAVGRRIVSQQGGVNNSAIRMGLAALEEEEMKRYMAGMAKARGLSGRWKFQQSLRTLDGLKKLPECDLLVVDYLQFMRGTGKTKSRREEIEEISAALKSFAVSRNAAVLAVSSLSRPKDKEAEKPPTLAQLRETGNLEYDADIAILMHVDPGDQSKVICRVEKNREGKIGKCELYFDRERVTLSDWEDWYGQDFHEEATA